MNKAIKACTLLGMAGLIGTAQLTLADGGCEPQDYVDGRPQFNRAQAAEKAGSFDEAYKIGKWLTEGCVSGVDSGQAVALAKRAAHQQGLQDEQQGRFLEAADWFRTKQWHDNVISHEDIDRVMMKSARTSADPDVFQTSHYYFQERKLGREDPRLQELINIAKTNGERELANEAKAFTPLRDTLAELSRASSWFKYVDSGVNKVFDRATQRGDSLVREEAPGPFERALEYYRHVENTAKENELRDRANRLGDVHAGKGEDALALRYYEIAARGDKAEQFRQKSEARQEKNETQRKKTFADGQKSLEEELGF